MALFFFLLEVDKLAGATIDHLVSVAVFIAALLLFVGLFMQTLYTAISYQRNRQVAVKASELLDGMLLNPGYPQNWGQSNVTPTSFGLQDSSVGGYALNPFSLMRLLPPTDPIFYPETGQWYSNFSLGVGGMLFVPTSGCIDYETASRLLGVNGTFGFQLSIKPIVEVSIQEIRAADPLILKVKVRGVGFPLSGAGLRYLFMNVSKPNDSEFPIMQFPPIGISQTDSLGEAQLSFSFMRNPTTSYAIIVYANLSGLSGVGYYSRETSGTVNRIIPLIQDFKERKILLVHNWDFCPPNQGQSAATFYNATFFLLSGNFELHQMPLKNSTGMVNSGQGKPYNTTVIPVDEPGFLVISYRSGGQGGQKFGVVLMPWGISTLGVSVVFGGDPFGQVWVASDLRQVSVNLMAYQAKIAVWSLEGYQGWSRK
jgi:hypothetical protein